MKPYALTTLILAVAAYISVVAAIEAPRKPKQEKAYVLPRVEEMPTNPTPFSL
jgi:hypothetical protein